MEPDTRQNYKYGDDHFLRLPFEMWVVIFRHADMLCSCPVNLSVKPNAGRGVGSSGSSTGKRKYGSTTSSTRRAMKNEPVVCVFHREGCIHTSFEPMLYVSPQARHITRKIVLQELPIHLTLSVLYDLAAFKHILRGFERMAPLEQSLRRLQVSLRSRDNRRVYSTGSRRSLVNLHKKFCNYAGEKLKGSLRNYVFQCQVGDYAVTDELLGQMKNNFQLLNTCAITFRTSMPRSLLSITKKAAIQATLCEEYTEKPFRFMDLPNELKIMILELLLVDKWDPDPLKRGPRRGYITLPRMAPITFPYSMEKCCSDCSTKLGKHCLCANTCKYSSSCTCYSSPVPLFLTSKFMYEIATSVFLGKNIFEFRNAPDTCDVLSRIRYKHAIRHLIIEVNPTDRIAAWIGVAYLIRSQLDLTRVTVDIIWDADISADVLSRIIASFDGIKGQRQGISR